MNVIAFLESLGRDLRHALRGQHVLNEFRFHALARLEPGVTPAEARTDIERMLPIWLDAWPIRPGVTLTREAVANWRITPVVRPLKDDVVGSIASTLWVLMARQ